MIQLDGSWSLGPKGPPQWSGQKSSSNFGTEFPHYRPPRPNRGLFSSQNKTGGLLLWDQFILGFESRFGEGWFSTFLVPLLLIVSKGNGPKWSIWPTTGPFHSIFVAIIFARQNNTNDTKVTQFGVYDGEIWRICGGKWGSRRGQLGICPPIGCFQAQLLPELGAIFLKTASWGAHTQSTFQKYPFLGPQLTTFGDLLL